MAVLGLIALFTHVHIFWIIGNCVINVYPSCLDELADPSTPGRALVLHGIEATGVVHAAMLRVQAPLLPIKLLVLSGH